MRITAGRWRGHNLYVPNNPDTRPTMDRTRQAVFNILRSAAWALKEDGTPLLQNATILDVFAGSGAMGLEALSQGAVKAVFFEDSADALQAIDKNVRKMKAENEVAIIKGDVLKIRANMGSSANMAFFDPPYKKELLVPALGILAEKNWIDASTLLVLEMQKYEKPVLPVTLHDERVYGLSKIIFGQLNLPL